MFTRLKKKSDTSESLVELVKNVPEWANWIAQNQDGTWLAYVEKPIVIYGQAAWHSTRLAKIIGKWSHQVYWGGTLMRVNEQKTDTLLADLRSRAPNWATFAAQDLDGHWWAYSDMPKAYAILGKWDISSAQLCTDLKKPADLNTDWQKTLTKLDRE